jgi:hypothetical protein
MTDHALREVRIADREGFTRLDPIEQLMRGRHAHHTHEWGA